MNCSIEYPEELLSSTENLLVVNILVNLRSVLHILLYRTL